MTTPKAGRWLAVTIPLAPLALLVYFLFEWLFFVTKPSALSAQPLSTRFYVLFTSPLPWLVPAFAAQVGATLVSLIAYPKIKAAALVPAAIIVGLLLFILLDNFTYTLIGFGVLRAGTAMRGVYAGILFSLLTLAGLKLTQTFERAVQWRRLPAAALAATLVLTLAPGAARLTAYDASAPPVLMPHAANQGVDRPNVLYLGIDGVEAEMLSAYGYSRRTSPFLEEVRDQSLFFENAFSNSGRTHGSLVTLLSGRLPFTTHVTFPPTVLQGDDAHRHMVRILKELGYTTMQLGMRHYADAEDVNLQGFDALNYRWQDLEAVQADKLADNESDAFRSAVAERLVERVGHLFGFRETADVFAHVQGNLTSPYWQDARRIETLTRYFDDAPEPWFVHTHFTDTHCCKYVPEQMHFEAGDAPIDTRDSQMRESDDDIRELFAALESSGKLERTVVVIYADHTAHWKTTGRVMLMIRFPNQAHRQHVRENAQLADVTPTVLDYLGLEIPAWMDGRSMLRPEKRPANRPIFAVNELAPREVVGNRMMGLLDPRPPNYGVATTSLIAGNKWYELQMADGVIESGPVPGHTNQSAASPSDAEARQIIVDFLTRAGFVVGAAH